MKKYFPKIFGNTDTKMRLSDAIIDKTLPHAILIVGPHGSGKSTLATEIAASANCLNQDSENHDLPCGICNNCKRIYSGNFPDISFLEKTSSKATIGVEELREFREDMFLSPTESAYKFYVIKDADIMTAAAQNALLKVLEEPPKSVHILLLASEADKILSTIKSRTQYIQTELFDYEKLYSYVTALSSTAEGLIRTDSDKLKALLLSSGGVIGKALEVLEGKEIENIASKRNLIKDFVSVFPKKTPFSKVYSAAMALPTKREELKSVLEGTLNALRDMITYCMCETVSPIFFLNTDEIDNALAGISKKRLLAIYDIITSALEDIDKNVVVSSLLTDVAIKMRS